MAELTNTKIYGDLIVGGNTTIEKPLMIQGCLTNTTTTNGFANYFLVKYGQSGLTFTTDRIIVPIAGNYLINFNTISNSVATRYDSYIAVNGTTICQALTDDAQTGYQYKELSIVVRLVPGDYIQFYNQNWYDNTNITYSVWRTASVMFLG